MARKVIDLPLHQDSASTLLPLMVGLMLYVIMLVGGAALGLSLYIQTTTQTSLSQVTLEIPASLAQHQQDTERKVLETLKRFPEIISAHPISSQQIRNTILPWLDPQKEEQNLLSSVSFPILIDMTLQKQSTDAPLSNLLNRLQQTFPEASLVVHEALVDHFSQGLKTLEWLAWGSAVVFLSVALLAVASTVQTGVAIHAPIVEILHLMGASERYISRQFQRQTLKTIWKSFLLAGFLLVLTFIFIQLFFLEGTSVYIPRTQEFYQHIALLFILVPVMSVALILLITHFTVIFFLRRTSF